MRLQGILQSWNERGYGVVIVRKPNFELVRYWLHFGKVDICEPLRPHAGCIVHFDVSDKPAAEGRLPQAVNAAIFEPETTQVSEGGQSILAGKATEGGVK